MSSELATVKELATAININATTAIDIYQVPAAPITKSLLGCMTIHNYSGGTVTVTIHYRANGDTATTANQAWSLSLDTGQTWKENLQKVLSTTYWVSVIAGTANTLRVWLDGAEIQTN